MSSVATTSKFSFYQIALPAVVVLLSGLSLAYSFGASGDIAIGAGNQPVADSSASVVAAEEHAPETASLPDNYSSRFAARYAARPPTSRQAADTSPALMLLHQNMADARGKKIDRDRSISELDHAHTTEPVDVSWSASSEADILSAAIEPVMLESGLQPKGIATDCRSNTCRISARFAESGDAQSWAGMLITQLGGTLSQVKMTVLPLPDGSSEVRIYGARKQTMRG
jgi:hypothetical protein